MPTIEVKERFGSRRNSGGTVELMYWALGSDDEAESRAAILGQAPLFYAGLRQTGITELEQQGNDLWFGTVAYSNGDLSTDAKVVDAEDDSTQEFNFATGGGSQHITQSLKAGTQIFPLASAPVFSGAIGVGSDGDVAGVDIGARQFDFSVSRTIPPSKMTRAYFRTLYDLTYTYNKNVAVSITLRPGIAIPFAKGELLFKGVNGSSSTKSGAVSLSFEFSALPNATKFPVGDIIIPKKLGWQYVWAYYGPDVQTSDSGAKFRITKPKAAYLEEIYEAGDLRKLDVR